MGLSISGARYSIAERHVRWLFRNAHNSLISRPFPLSLFVSCRNETTILNVPVSVYLHCLLQLYIHKCFHNSGNASQVTLSN